MLGKLALAATFVCAATSALAQSANPFVGDWNVTFSSQDRKGFTVERQATMTLTESGGRWRTYLVGGTRDPCSGQETPIEIKSLDDKQLVGTLKFSSLADFCKDLALVLKREDNGRVTGRRGDTELSLSRK